MTHATKDETSEGPSGDGGARAAGSDHPRSELAVSRQEFEALQALVARLSAQVARLAEATPVPEQHLAIMAAVFAQFLGRPVRVRSARRLGGPSSSWSQEGRSSLHSQRHVRRG